MLGIASIEKLVHELSQLPGIGPKTAQRLAYFILKSPSIYAEGLSDSIRRVKAEVHTCPQCFNFTDVDICKFCTDPQRSDEILCVVEEPSDIIRIEASNAFRGRFHVLHGAISPLEGVRPEDLRIRELINRAQSPVREVILALDADLEGDTTVLYLTRLLANRGIKVTRIAHGVPIGSDIDYIDERTMNRALENRVEL